MRKKSLLILNTILTILSLYLFFDREKRFVDPNFGYIFLAVAIVLAIVTFLQCKYLKIIKEF